MANKLDEALEQILEQLQTGTIYADNTEPMLTNNREIAKQAIKDLIREVVIGEDMPLNTKPDTGQRIVNKLKAEQRKIVV